MNASKDYLEVRGLDGVLRDSLFIVETTFENDYSDLDASEVVGARLDDIGYDLEAIN